MTEHVDNAGTTEGLQRREVSGKGSEPQAAKGLAEKGSAPAPGINAEEVADRVYRLMQRDLFLERERVTKRRG